MTLTDRPLTTAEAHDHPRLITAVVTTTHDTRPAFIETVSMSCHSHDLDPEFRQPVLWLALMLDQHKHGPRLLADWKRFHEDTHPDQVNVTIWVDGEYVLDESGFHALDSIEYAIAQAERSAVNP